MSIRLPLPWTSILYVTEEVYGNFSLGWYKDTFCHYWREDFLLYVDACIWKSFINETNKNHYASTHLRGWRHYVFGLCVCPPVRPNLFNVITIECMKEIHWNLFEVLTMIWHELIRFWVSYVKGQGHHMTKYFGVITQFGCNFYPRKRLSGAVLSIS